MTFLGFLLILASLHTQMRIYRSARSGESPKRLPNPFDRRGH